MYPVRRIGQWIAQVHEKKLFGLDLRCCVCIELFGRCSFGVDFMMRSHRQGEPHIRRGGQCTFSPDLGRTFGRGLCVGEWFVMSEVSIVGKVYGGFDSRKEQQR